MQVSLAALELIGGLAELQIEDISKQGVRMSDFLSRSNFL